MTKLLESAIAEMRKLPPEDQDEAAEMLLWAIETRRRVLPLEEEIIAAIKEGLHRPAAASSQRMMSSAMSGSGMTSSDSLTDAG